ncbi:MAG: hypothetical protein HY459_02715 [Parcubacteria group bacterium]|nr:hypothetical protein [Parcubacteria group bacterium]
MGNPETEPHPEQNVLADEISKRAETASEKIKQRIQEIFIPNINQHGSFAERWLRSLHNDFYALVENPDDESGGGNYEGWTADEIKELYSVLYGEEMD